MRSYRSRFEARVRGIRPMAGRVDGEMQGRFSSRGNTVDTVYSVRVRQELSGALDNARRCSLS
jgi:hypothetical protein